MRTLRRLLDLAHVSAWRVGLALLLGVLAAAFGIALITAAGYLISRAAEHPPILSLSVVIVAVRFFGLARPLARYAERLAGHDLAFRSLARIRTSVYARIEPLAPAGLESYRSGELLGRMVGDIDTLQGLYLRCFGPPLVALTVGSACVVVTASAVPAAGLVLATGLLVGGVAVPALAGALAGTVGRRQVAARGELTAALVETLRGAPELVVYGHEDETLARIGRTDAQLARLGRRDALVAGLADGLGILVAGLTVAGVLGAAITAHQAGTLDRVLVPTLALLALASFEPLAPVSVAARELSGTLAAGRRVLELTDREPVVRDPASPVPPPPASPVVALEGVTARYAPDAPAVLEGFDLRLEPGSHVALVGPSGSGKTTVTNLLFRFLDPVAGAVTIAGVDARLYTQEDVRSTFALAGQEAHLFNSTIRENLRLARPSADDGELLESLRKAQIADWVTSLPQGLDTVVGEAGGRLSGGQRQRLVLARALLADRPVLVLDEPTAHLDATNAEQLMSDVLDASGDRTVLLITHRVEGLDRMDAIVRLEEPHSGRASSSNGHPRPHRR